MSRKKEHREKLGIRVTQDERALVEKFITAIRTGNVVGVGTPTPATPNVTSLEGGKGGRGTESAGSDGVTPSSTAEQNGRGEGAAPTAPPILGPEISRNQPPTGVGVILGPEITGPGIKNTPSDTQSPPPGPDPYWDEVIPDPDDAVDQFGVTISRRALYERTKARESAVGGVLAEKGPPTPPAPDGGEEKPKKLPKGKEWMEGWELYVPILLKLPLESPAHERENVLRFLARDPKEARYHTTPVSGETLFEWHTEGLTKEEVATLLDMPQALAMAFYVHLTHGHHGTGLDPRTGFEFELP